jgi:hypothetical protein
VVSRERRYDREPENRRSESTTRSGRPFLRGGDGLATLDAPWVAGRRDDEVEDDLFGQQVEEVPTINNAIEALLDDAKEWVERLEGVGSSSS